MMKKDWKKKYSFRLIDDDEEVADFLRLSKKTSSETIRELLRFAINELKKQKKEREDNRFHFEIKNQLQEIKQAQQENHNQVIEKINQRIAINDPEITEGDSKDVEKVNKSIESSIDSMLDLFGKEND